MKYLLGIDCGGTLTKAGLFDAEGCEISIAQEPIEVMFPAEGMMERDAEHVKNATIGVIKKVLAQTGIDSADIIGISPTGQGNGLYLLDENGSAAHPFIMSGDIRAKEYIKKWSSEGLVGNIFMPKTYQTIWAGQPVALLAWLRDNDPDTLKRSKYAICCKDYLRYILTGEVRAEMTETSGWSCMDIRKGEYDDELFASVGLSEYRRLFPPVILSTDIGGRVTREAANATGLTEGTPVMGGMFDITACPLGTGVLDSSRISIVAGSWSINSYVDTEPSKEVFMTTRYFVPGYYQISEASATSASNLEWFIGRLMQHEKEDDVYKTVNEMVASVDTRDCPVFFLPFLFGTNANIDAKSAFIGLSGIHTKAHMLRAVFEGIVFCHRYHLEKLYLTRPKESFEAVRISGGVTQSKLWVQMFADITGLPMEVSSAKELGVLGSAMCAGIGCGEYKDAGEAAEKFVSIEKTVYPDKDTSAYYEKKYALYKGILDSLDSIWSDFAEI